MPRKRNCRGGPPWPPVGRNLCEGRAATAGGPYNYTDVVRFLLLITIIGVPIVAHCQMVTERSSHFRVVHPQMVDARETEYILDLLEHNRSELLDRVSKANLNVRFPNLDLTFNATTGGFVARTGMPPWAAAVTSKNKIELQPLALLKQRQILETSLRHELAHALIDTLSNNQ